MLALDHVVAGYDDSIVLRDVSLHVAPGSVVALIGPNGAGKTTLLRAASGLLRPKSGTISLEGRPLAGKEPEAYVRAGICHIPEGRGIFRSMTVKENLLLYAGSATGGALDLAIEAFPQLGRHLGQRAGTLSGGEQQMLALSRAYLSKPTYVLLDEVSLGLAPRVVDEIFVFLRRIVDQGASLLLVEQYVSRALQMADSVYLLTQGKIAFTGKPDEVDSADVFRTYLGADVS